MCNPRSICKKLFLKNNIFWKRIICPIKNSKTAPSYCVVPALFVSYIHYPKSFLKTLRHNMTFRLLTVANQLWCKIANLTVNKVDITMSLQFSRYPFSHYLGKNFKVFSSEKLKKFFAAKWSELFLEWISFLVHSFYILYCSVPFSNP